jgi:hypothetical protein
MPEAPTAVQSAVAALRRVPPEIALAAMVVIGVANATYDVALFTIFQRAAGNNERASVMSVRASMATRSS